MKRFLLLVAMATMMFVLVVGCGDKADEATDKVPVETKEAEMADTTRLDEGTDSTMADSTAADTTDPHAGHDHN